MGRHHFGTNKKRISFKNLLSNGLKIGGQFLACRMFQVTDKLNKVLL
jgi:hypothetical protein